MNLLGQFFQKFKFTSSGFNSPDAVILVRHILTKWQNLKGMYPSPVVFSDLHERGKIRKYTHNKQRTHDKEITDDNERTDDKEITNDKDVTYYIK